MISRPLFAWLGDLAPYLPTLVQSCSDCGLVQDAFHFSGTTPSPDDPYRVPPYGTMCRILDAWDSQKK